MVFIRHKLIPITKVKDSFNGKSLDSFPWSKYNKNINYKKNLCPIAENLQRKTFIGFEICLFELTKKDILNIAKAFIKVWKCLKI